MSNPDQGGNPMSKKENNFDDFEEVRNKAVEEEYSREVLEWLKERTPQEYHDHPEFGEIPHNTQCDSCVELVHERSASGRKFVKIGDTGTVFIQKCKGDLHIRNEKEEWISLNTQLLPSEQNPDRFIADEQPVPTGFDRNSGYSFIEMENGVRFRYNRELYLLHLDDEGQTLREDPVDLSKTSVGGDGTFTENAWPGIDREAVHKTSAIKTDYKIREPLALNDTSGWIVFEDRIELKGSMKIVPDEEGERIGNGILKGDLLVVDASGKELLRWEAPDVFDIERDHLKATGYKVLQDGNEYKVRTYVDASWLEDGQRNYPITVDPLVSGSNTYSAGQIGFTDFTDDGSGQCGNSLDYCAETMNVNVPGQSVIQDVLWELDYEAECTVIGGVHAVSQDDGGFILEGPCGESPSTPGNWWSCNTGCANCGTCGGATSSAPQLADCLSPQCSDYNITFTTKNIHCNVCGQPAVTYGTCNTSYHYVVNNSWIMTVEARTVESTAPIASTNGTTICEGQSTDLSVGAQYGVSPYTYTWTPGGMTGTPVTVSPTSTTTYDVEIEDNCGNTTTESITINVDPAPTVDAGADATICEGDDHTLNGSFGGSASSITWSSSGDGSFSNSSDPNATYTPGTNDISNGSVTLTITTDNPSGPCTAVSDNMTITIEPAPTVDAGANATICEGDDHTLSGSFGGSATGLDWSTSGDGSFSNTTDPNATYTPGTNDVSNGSVTLTATSTGGCDVISDNMTLTIDPQTTTDAGADASICEGDSYNLNGNFGGTASSITWSSSGDGSFNNNSDPNATYTPGPNDESNGSVTLTITTDDPAGPCGPASDNMTLTIDPLPSVSFSGLNSPYCDDGTPDTLTGNQAPSGSFSGNGVTDLGSGEGEFDPNAVSPGTHEVYYSYTDGNGCTNVDTQTVDVNPLPTVSFSGLNSPYCDNVSGDTLVGNQAPNGTFSGTAGVTDLGSGEGYFDPTAAGTGTHEVYYSYTDGNGCSNTDTQSVDVLESPTLDSSNITISDATCGNSDGAIENITVSGGTSPYTPEWRDASNTVVGNSMDLTGVPSGDYTLTVSDANGCSDTLGPITVSDIGAPTVDAGADVTICEEDSVTIGGSPTASGGTSPYTYSWNNGGSLDDASIANPSASPASTTTYTVTVTDDNNCSSTDNMTLTVDPAPTVDAGPDSSVCADDTATMNGSFGGGASSATWNSLGDGNFANANDPNTTYVPGSNDISAGSVILTLSTNDPSGPCSEAVDSMELDILQLPNTSPSNELICKGDSISIGVGSGSSHIWNTGAMTDSIDVGPSDDSTYWVQSTGANGCTVTDTILVEVDTPKTVQAMADTLQLDAGASADIDVTQNDSGSPFLLSDLDQPSDGSLEGPMNGFFTYSSDGNAETDEFSYWICDLACGNSCDTADVHIMVDHEEEEEFFIPNGVSANGDGYNDAFYISGLDEYPENSLQIFNRWGNEVFRAEPYQNDWQGQSKNGEVIEGTYYYVLDLGPDEEKKTGFIELKR